MRVLSMLVRLIDRELAFWDKPVLAMLVGMLPIIALDPLVDGPPSDAPLKLLIPALLVCAAWEGLVIWRYISSEIKKFKDLRALGAEEEAAKKNA